MSKSKSCEARMFFTTIPMGIMNAICAGLFFINTILYIFIEFKDFYKGKFTENHAFFAIFYETLAFLFFLRIFYGTTISRIKFSLPFSKKLFIRDNSLALTVICSIIMIFSVLFALIFKNKGVETSYLLGLVLFTSLMQILISILVPLLFKYTMKEKFSSGFFVQTKPVYLCISILLTLFIPILPSYLIREFCFTALCNFASSIPFWSFCLICILSLILCYLISYYLFYRNYKKR